MAIRTESLNIRIDPRTKYLAQVASAQRRVSLATLINGELLDAVRETLITEANVKTSLLDLADELWTEHEADRLVMLNERLPFLMTADQARLWAHIQATQKYWFVSLSAGEWGANKTSFNFEALRADWDKLTAKYGKGGL